MEVDVISVAVYLAKLDKALPNQHLCPRQPPLLWNQDHQQSTSRREQRKGVLFGGLGAGLPFTLGERAACARGWRKVLQPFPLPHEGRMPPTPPGAQRQRLGLSAQPGLGAAAPLPWRSWPRTARERPTRQVLRGGTRGQGGRRCRPAPGCRPCSPEFSLFLSLDSKAS